MIQSCDAIAPLGMIDGAKLVNRVVCGEFAVQRRLLGFM
jgi:hypothetical protein